jgi:hypothetical protein
MLVRKGALKKAVATEESLRRRLDEFEEEFGLRSADFYRLHELGDAPEDIPPFQRVVWADTCRRWRKAVSRSRSKVLAHAS